MKIFHIKSNEGTLETGQRFIDLVTALADLGIEQKAILPEGPLAEALRAANIAVETAKFSGLFDLRTRQAAQDRINSFNPHIIQTHCPGSQALTQKITSGAVNIGFADTPDAARQSGMLCLNVCYPEPGNRLEYDLLPVPPLVQPPGKSDTVAFARDKAQTPAGAPLLGMMMDWVEAYDVDPILGALRGIGNAHLWIAGQGPRKSHYIEKAKRQAIHDRVHFIEDVTSWPSLLRTLDICLIPFRRAGVDRLTLQAWSCGTCVLSGMPAAASPLTPGTDGLRVNGQNVMQWREAISRLCSDKELRLRLAVAGQEKFTAAFSASAVVKSYLRSYESALNIKTG